MPRSWEPVQGKKGVKRYTSDDLRTLVKAREAAFDQREWALSGILQVGREPAGLACVFGIHARAHVGQHLCI